MGREYQQLTLPKMRPVCEICGLEVLEKWEAPTAASRPHLDHVIPRSLGGDDRRGNLRIVHAFCNQAKSSNYRLSTYEFWLAIASELDRENRPLRLWIAQRGEYISGRPLPSAAVDQIIDLIFAARPRDSRPSRGPRATRMPQERLFPSSLHWDAQDEAPPASEF